MSNSTTVLTGLGFPEGLRWHHGELWLCDMRSRRVISVTTDKKPRLRAYCPAVPSGLGWLPDGTPLVSSMLDQCVVAFRNGWREVHASLAEVAIGQVNDMLVDRHGRSYVGSMGIDLLYEKLDADFVNRIQPVSLALVHPDGRVSRAADGLRCPNGMALSEDGSTLVVAESAAKRVVTYAVQPDGSLANQEVLAEFDAMPDGLCMDREGMVWVALLTAERFVRVSPAGSVVEVINCPGRLAVDCVLGGADGRTLYGALTEGPETAFGPTGEVSGMIESWVVDVPGPSSS